MARDTDNKMVGGEAMAAVLEKTKEAIDSLDTSLSGRISAVNEKASTAVQPNATYSYDGNTYTVDQLLQAVAKLMESTVVING